MACLVHDHFTSGQVITSHLTAFLSADLVMRHKQLHGWVKRGMVPTFDHNGQMKEQAIARGRLTSVWLGGLVNPQALLTAMQQEKAVLVNKSIDEVSVCVYVGGGGGREGGGTSEPPGSADSHAAGESCLGEQE